MSGPPPPPQKKKGLTVSELAGQGLIVDGANCGLPFTAEVYFIAYFLFIGLMIIGIVVAVVLDANAESSAADASPVKDEHLLSFQLAWTTLDKSATGYIRGEQLPVLLKKVAWPLGLERAPTNVNKGVEAIRIARATIDYCQVTDDAGAEPRTLKPNITPEPEP